MFTFANPNRFFRLTSRVQPLLAGLAVVLLSYGLWQALVVSPPDYQQGETVRIMYVHVPAAWLAMGIYTSMAIAACVSLIWGHLLAELYCRAAAPLGTAMTALCLITGSLWGAPMWGTWWVWDARLTSVLVLFFFYLGYLALVQETTPAPGSDKASSILLLVGFVNLPIVKFSVDWWATLHQPAGAIKLGKQGLSSTLDPAMLQPLLVMGAAYMCGFSVLVLMRLKTEYEKRRALLSALKVI